MKYVIKTYIAACIITTIGFLLGSSNANAGIMYTWNNAGISGSFTLVDQGSWGGEEVSMATKPAALTSFEFTINPTWGLGDVTGFVFTAQDGTGTIVAEDGGGDYLIFVLAGMGDTVVEGQFDWYNPKTDILQTGELEIDWVEVTPIPEPSTGLLLGIVLVGLVGAGTVRKIKQKKAVANT